MRSVKGVNTSCELLLRKALWTNGVRGYRLHSKTVYGKPDLVFTKTKVAVFVDGCFWHGCPQCCRVPTANRDYWVRKIEGNRARRLDVDCVLSGQGWKVIRFWEHEVHDDIRNCVESVLQALSGGHQD